MDVFRGKAAARRKRSTCFNNIDEYNQFASAKQLTSREEAVTGGLQ